MIYKIAECMTEYNPIYEYLAEKMKAYQWEQEEKIDISLTLTEEICHLKQQEQRHLTIEQCAYIYAGMEFYTKLLLHGGMMLHASAVAMEEKCYLFSAPSGTGKSTHTKQWQKLFGEEKAVIINDDKPALRRNEDRWYVYGTPFSGKTDEQLNRKVKLQGICLLERGEKNEIQKLLPKEAISSLMRQTLVPKRMYLAEQLLKLMNQLLCEIPVYKMKCDISTEAAKLAYEAMVENNGEK